MESDNPQQRMQALAAALQPVREWIAGAQALALLQGALQAGIVEAARIPRTLGEIAEECGIASERAADVCAALEAHGVLARIDGRYQLADAFALLASPESLIPLGATVARGVAEAHLLETIARPDHAYARSASTDLRAFARGDSVNPSSPLRHGLTFLAQPELQRLFARGARHLELGCGVGGGILSILNTNPNVTAVGVELEAGLLAVARTRAEALGVTDRVEWRHGDARDIADEAAFDRVAWSQYYFPADTRAATLEAAYRALKPGGYLLASMLPDPPPSDAEANGPVARAYAITRLMYGAWGIPVRTANELRAEAEQVGLDLHHLLTGRRHAGRRGARPVWRVERYSDACPKVMGWTRLGRRRGPPGAGVGRGR